MFRLCLQLGVASPDLLARQLTVQQLAEWAAYAQMEPFGQDVHPDYVHRGQQSNEDIEQVLFSLV